MIPLWFFMYEEIKKKMKLKTEKNSNTPSSTVEYRPSKQNVLMAGCLTLVKSLYSNIC